MPLICPVDHTLMTPRYVQGVEIDVCPRCGGIWMDDGELSAINSSPLSNNTLRSTDKAAAPAFDPLPPRPDRSLRCPRDGQAMTPYQFAYSSGIVLDSCPACAGIFLDSGELTQIADFQSSDTLRHGPDPAKVAAARARRESPKEPRRLTEDQAIAFSTLIGTESRDRMRRDERWQDRLEDGHRGIIITSILEEVIDTFMGRRWF